MFTMSREVLTGWKRRTLTSSTRKEICVCSKSFTATEQSAKITVNPTSNHKMDNYPGINQVFNMQALKIFGKGPRDVSEMRA